MIWATRPEAKAEVTVPSLDDWEKEWQENPQRSMQPKLLPVDSQLVWRGIQRRFGRTIQFCGVTKPGCRNGAATWAARNLPARLDVAATAKLLGFAEHDIQILMAIGKLPPRGDPATNAPKWFAAVETI